MYLILIQTIYPALPLKFYPRFVSEPGIFSLSDGEATLYETILIMKNGLHGRLNYFYGTISVGTIIK